MYIIDSYSLAVLGCFITMLCWGSWANTQKLATKSWPSQLYYWDYTIGVVLLALIFGLTLGSSGDAGRSFFDDLGQANADAYLSAFLGGVIFNLSNLLIVAAIDIAGMAIAFPIAVGIALVLGVIVNYLKTPTGDPIMLFVGVSLIVVAIIVNSLASRKITDKSGKTSAKGILVSVASGLIMAFFYRFVADSMSLNFSNPEAGKFTPYSAVFIFSIGILLSNFLWNGYFMKFPIKGEVVRYKDYLTRGTLKLHLIGILGGLIWNTGMSLSIIAAEKAGPAISYGLGQGATLIAAIWGVFIWKEFKDAPKTINKYIISMFLFFLAGLALIIIAGL